jgi:adenine deaminase
MTREEFLRRLPKVELHCHLYGTVRKSTFAEMAARRRAPITPAQIDQYYTRLRKPWPANNVLRALDEHLVQDGDDLYRLTLEYLEDAVPHGVRYAEFFWNPTATVQAGIPFAGALSAIVSAVHDAERRYGIIGRVVPAIDRERGLEAALQMLEWVIANRVLEAPGIGMDFDEVPYPPELYAQAYRRARAAGLRVTVHAGENGASWRNVATAIDVLGVDRIEHGYTVIDNAELARRCAERGIVFTVIPTNSYYLRTLPDERWAVDHPIRTMARLGLRLHPNTDNPTLHKVTQTEAWLMMMRDFGFGLEQVRGFMYNGLDAAWINKELRAKWRRQWTVEFDALSAELDPRHLYAADRGRELGTREH